MNELVPAGTQFTRVMRSLVAVPKEEVEKMEAKPKAKTASKPKTK